MPIIFILFAFCLDLSAYMRIDVPTPEYSGTLLSINKFTGDDGAELAKIVAKDLAKTSSFTSIYYDQSFNLLQLTKDRVEFFLKGSVMKEDHTFRVSIEFGSVPQLGKTIFMEERSYTNVTLRELGHIISNKIYEHYTGNKGIFNSEIAYVNYDREKNRHEIYVADLDGYDPKLIVSSKETIMSPSFSPDGQKMAYVIYKKGRPFIEIYNFLNKKKMTLKSFSGLNHSPTFSPSGKDLALVLSIDGSSKIYRYIFAENKFEKLTFSNSIDAEPEWVSDQEILFTSNRNGTAQVFKTNIYSKQVQRVTFDSTYSAGAKTISPEEFICIKRTEPGVFKIALESAKAIYSKIISTTGFDGELSVVGDGKFILYKTKVGKNNKIVLGTIDGKSHSFIKLDQKLVKYPTWRPMPGNKV